MKSSLLGGFAIATTLLIQSAPASSQGVYGAGHPRVGHSYLVTATLVAARRGININIAAMRTVRAGDMALGPASPPWRRAH